MFRIHFFQRKHWPNGCWLSRQACCVLPQPLCNVMWCFLKLFIHSCPSVHCYITISIEMMMLKQEIALRICTSLKCSFTNSSKILYKMKVFVYKMDCIIISVFFFPLPQLCTLAKGQVINRKMNEIQTANMIKQAATSTDVRKQKILEAVCFIKSFYIFRWVLQDLVSELISSQVSWALSRVNDYRAMNNLNSSVLYLKEREVSV
jgi:hypothetical protein